MPCKLISQLERINEYISWLLINYGTHNVSNVLEVSSKLHIVHQRWIGIIIQVMVANFEANIWYHHCGGKHICTCSPRHINTLRGLQKVYMITIYTTYDLQGSNYPIRINVISPYSKFTNLLIYNSIQTRQQQHDKFWRNRNKKGHFHITRISFGCLRWIHHVTFLYQQWELILIHMYYAVFFNLVSNIAEC